MTDSDLPTINLKGAVALVTGGGSGIGAAICIRLGEANARVVVVDKNHQAALQVVDEVTRLGAEAIAVQCDLAVTAARISMMDEVHQRFGSVDILVNNAADHGARVDFLEIDWSAWDRIIATNLTATAHLSQLCAREMQHSRSGAIVNLAAIQAQLPVATYSAYVASKGGILSLTRALAVELSPLGIRVNAVSPGAIETGSTVQALKESGTGASTAPTLIGRMGTALDVADTVLFLVSNNASFITGEVIVVDGGRSLSRSSDPFAAFGRPR